MPAKIAAVMINAGVEFWDKYTKRAIDTLNAHAKDPYQLIVVDNGGTGRGDLNIPDMVSYAEAVNQGVELVADSVTRLFILNNDIIVKGHWQEKIEAHPLCGPMILRKEGVDYIEGWALSVERDLWHMLGGFNERFHNSWEDVDFCWRARRLGVLSTKIALPIFHFWGATRNKIPGSNKWDEDNRLFLLNRIKASNNRSWKRKG